MILLSYKTTTVIRTLFRFLFFNLIIGLGLNFFYILFTSGAHQFLSLFFLQTALISNTIQIHLLIALPIVILLLFIPNRIVMTVLCALVYSLLHILNLMDIFIYKLFNFHINSMVINLLSAEGGEDSLRLGIGTYLTAALLIFGIIAFEFLVIQKLDAKFKDQKIARKSILIISILCLVFVLTDKVTYAISDLYNKNAVTRFSKVYPLYQPMTIKRMMRKKFNFKVDREDAFHFDKTYTGLDYPKSRLQSTPLETYPNIIWIMLDAWRYDMLTEEVTPNIYRFSKETLVFDNCYSGGNASRFGVFTLFYAIHGYYWHYFIGERRSPVFMDELIKLGYDFNIISSRQLSSPEFRKTVFIRIPEYIVDELPGKDSETKDPLVAQTFIEWLDKRKSDKPFFSFLFFNASHRPYRYPDNFEKFKPSNKDPNYFTVGEKDAVALKNSYMNAIHFEDHQIGKILEVLKNKKLTENSIIMITGDHGEEFYETGFWGHTSSFSKYQTRVPLVLSIPGMNHQTISRLTSNLDVVPTMLELLGYVKDHSGYSLGRSLFSDEEHEFVVASGWDDCGIIDRDHYIVFSFETYKPGAFEVRDSEYKIIANEKEILKQKRKNVIHVLNDFKNFIK